jgi:hypothetical protein
MLVSWHKLPGKQVPVAIVVPLEQQGCVASPQGAQVELPPPPVRQ